jgi:uncharacterized membrane protein YadS
MTSKQGEGGSVHVSGGTLGRSNSNHCVNSAISLPTTIWRLIIDGVCLVLVLLLFWLWARARRRTPNIKETLPWFTFGVLLALTITYVKLYSNFYVKY